MITGGIIVTTLNCFITDMKVLLISAACGCYHNPVIVNQIGVNCDIVQLNDTNFKTRSKSMLPRLNAKIPKMLAWELYQGNSHYMWVDASFNLNSPYVVLYMLDRLGNKDAVFFNIRMKDIV